MYSGLPEGSNQYKTLNPDRNESGDGNKRAP